MTTTYRSQTDVARWCGVQPPAVSNWIRRFPGKTPAPDVVIATDGSSSAVRGWLPERRREWEAFAARLNAPPGRAAAGAATRRARRAAEMIAQGAEDGTIDPAEAVRLLRELI